MPALGSREEELERTNAILAAAVERLTATVEAQAVQLGELSEKLDAALRRLHGKKSERRPKVPPPVAPRRIAR